MQPHGPGTIFTACGYTAESIKNPQVRTSSVRPSATVRPSASANVAATLARSLSKGLPPPPGSSMTLAATAQQQQQQLQQLLQAAASSAMPTRSPVQNALAKVAAMGITPRLTSPSRAPGGGGGGGAAKEPREPKESAAGGGGGGGGGGGEGGKEGASTTTSEGPAPASESEGDHAAPDAVRFAFPSFPPLLPEALLPGWRRTTKRHSNDTKRHALAACRARTCPC